MQTPAYSPILLGVNIDHAATLRQARGTRFPDPVQVALMAERAGADSITLHLREDRRHIQERDVYLLKELSETRMNLEMAVDEDVMAIAEEVQPADCCLVPERREELTTEGGLDVSGHYDRVRDAVSRLLEAGIRVSLFIDPEPAQIVAAARSGAPCVEFHTGYYADAPTARDREQQLRRLASAAVRAEEEGLLVNAGHGLNYRNVQDIAAIPQVRELNIGHAIICEAIFCGIEPAVSRMLALMRETRPYRPAG